MIGVLLVWLVVLLWGFWRNADTNRNGNSNKGMELRDLREKLHCGNGFLLVLDWGVWEVLLVF